MALKKLLLLTFIAAILSSCGSNKVAVQYSPETPVAQKKSTKWRAINSTVEVEVKDSLTDFASEESAPAKSTRNRAVVTVVPCDQIAANTEAVQSEISNTDQDQKLKSNTIQGVDLSSLSEKLLPASAAKSAKRPMVQKLKTIKQLKKIQKKAKEKAGLDRLIYIILVILLVLLIFRLLEILVGPLFHVLLLVVLIVVIGHLLGIW